MGGDSAGGSVLIVEDEFLVSLQLEDILFDGGHRVVATAPDIAALSSITEAPQVALVDLNLRDGLTGPQAAWDLSERYGAVVIYVTANPGQIGEPAPTAIGIVQKPFTRDAILSSVAYALAGCPPEGRPAMLEPIEPFAQQQQLRA